MVCFSGRNLNGEGLEPCLQDTPSQKTLTLHNRLQFNVTVPREYLIQVAYSVVEDAAYEREFAPFGIVDNSRRKLLITHDENDFSTSTVQHIRLKDFLCMQDL